MSGRAVLVLSLVLSFPLTASAQQLSQTSRAAARDLGVEGVAAFKRGAYPEAFDKLQRAYEVVHAPTLGLWTARALVRLGRWVEAAERYREVGRLDSAAGVNSAVQEKAKADAEQEAAELRPRIPALELNVQGAPGSDVTLTLDGGPLPSALIGTRLPINPGHHELDATYQGQSQRLELTALEGKVLPVNFRFRAVPSKTGTPGTAAAATMSSASEVSDRSRGRRFLGYVGIGVGSAGVVLGSVYGVLALKKHSALEPACDGGHCLTSHGDEVASYNTTRTISSIGLIAGGVVALSGVVLVLTAPRSVVSVSLAISPRALAIGGAL